MDETTRAIAVLAVVTLAVAPLVNGVLQDAAATADRLFLKDADWQGEPPEDYQGDPPEDMPPPEDGEEQNMTGPGGVSPSCSIVEEPTEAVWYHGDPANSTMTGIQRRVFDQDNKQFTVEDRHVGLGVRLEVKNFKGTLSATVYPEGSPGDAILDQEHNSVTGEDLNKQSTVTRPTLTTGTWVAELDFRQATYDELTFVNVLASCAGSGNAEGSQ